MGIDLSNDAPAAAVASAVPQKRGRGKPKGYPKPPGSGRQRIDPNGDYRAAIARLGRPFEFQCDALRRGWVIGPDGKRVNLSVDQRMGIARFLTRFLIPELKAGALELSGPGGGPIEVGDAEDKKELARKIVFALRAAGQAQPRENVTIEHVAQPEIEPTAERPSAYDEATRQVSGGIGVSTSDGTHTSTHHSHTNTATESVGIGNLTVTRRADRWWILDADGRVISIHATRSEAERIATNKAAEQSASPAFADSAEHFGGYNRRRM